MTSVPDDPTPAAPADTAGAHEPYLDAPQRDRSYLAILAWTFGLLVMGILMYRFVQPPGASTTRGVRAPGPAVQHAPPRPQQAHSVGRMNTNPLNPNASERQQAIVNAAGKKINLVTEGSSVDSRDRIVLTGFVDNGSDLAIRSWNANVSFS